MIKAFMKGRETRLGIAVLLLVVCDPLLAFWPNTLRAEDPFTDEIDARVAEEWTGAVELSSELGHALGMSISDFPHVWGNAFGSPAPRGFPPRSELTVDGAFVGAGGAEKVVWSLRDRLSSSVVQVVSGETVVACADYDGMRLDCGERPYQFVGKYAGPIQGVDLPCVWLHPSEDGELLVRVLDLPKTHRVTGYLGLLDGSGKRADVHVEGRFNGRKLFKATVNKDRKIVSIKGVLPSAASGHLELRIRTVDADWRLMCAGVFGVGRDE